jgi:hypothetical protein
LIAAQVPFPLPVSALAQDIHVPVHALLQQKPLAQKPDMHSVLPPQDPPSCVLH